MEALMDSQVPAERGQEEALDISFNGNMLVFGAPVKRHSPDFGASLWESSQTMEATP